MYHRRHMDTYTPIIGIYPSLNSYKFEVNDLELDNFLSNGLVSHDGGPWFMHCRDNDGDIVYIDMTKLLAFYVLSKSQSECSNAENQISTGASLERAACKDSKEIQQKSKKEKKNE